MSVVVADKRYDSEDNHVLVRELDAFSVIPARYEDVPIWKTHGSNKMVVWRTGYIKVGKNTEELSFRCIAYKTCTDQPILL